MTNKKTDVCYKLLSSVEILCRMAQLQPSPTHSNVAVLFFTHSMLRFIFQNLRNTHTNSQRKTGFTIHLHTFLLLELRRIQTAFLFLAKKMKKVKFLPFSTNLIFQIVETVLLIFIYIPYVYVFLPNYSDS